MKCIHKLCAWREAQADPGYASLSRFNDIARQAGLADRVAQRLWSAAVSRRFSSAVFLPWF